MLPMYHHVTESPDYIVDIGRGAPAHRAGGASSSTGRQPASGRPWLSVMWKCCGAYSRVYRNRAGTAYVGNCPRCAKPVRIRIGPGGTAHRLFEAW